MKKHARLGQWNGRRHSTRKEEHVLPRLWQRPVFLRLGLVLITALVVTCLAYRWIPARPFRVGETYQHDLRARVYFELSNSERARDAAPDQVSTNDDPMAREEARRDVPPAVEKYSPGML